jgi:hypothetical protein
LNDPKAIELLEMARQKRACLTRFAPYESKAAANCLQRSDISREDAVWMLGVVRPKAFWNELKEVAKGHAALVFIKE